MNSFLAIFRQLKPYRRRFYIGTIFRICSDLCALYPAYGLATIINSISRNTFSFRSILVVLVTWCVLMILRHIFMYYCRRYVHEIAKKVEIDVLHEGMAHLVRIDSVWHEKENSGNKIKRIQSAAESYDDLIRIWVGSGLGIIVNFIGIGFILSRIDARITAIVVVYIAVFFWVSRIFLKRAGAANRDVNIIYEEANGFLFENVNSIRTVKLLNLKDYVLRRYTKVTDRLLAAVVRRITWFQQGTVLANVWTHVVITGSIGFIVYGIWQGRYEVGFIALFYAYFTNIRESVNEMATISENIIIGNQRIERYLGFKAIKVVIDSDEDKHRFPRDWKTIVLSNVSFSYEGHKVLRNVSLEIRRGERIGIIGLSGAGKSTLFKLLLKEREDYTGEITVDGMSLRGLSASSYRSRIGVMLQDTEVFNLSLRDNISVGSRPSPAHFAEVLRIAHITEFAAQLKDGLNTMIGEKGIKLSGGQRQRVGIARALLRQPEILFFDEATSHLDIESEAKIRDALSRAFAGITAVVIAHRLTTIKEMDRIIVIEKGRIIEEGSFNELYAKQGRFYCLWEQQKII